MAKKTRKQRMLEKWFDLRACIRWLGKMAKDPSNGMREEHERQWNERKAEMSDLLGRFYREFGYVPSQQEIDRVPASWR